MADINISDHQLIFFVKKKKDVSIKTNFQGRSHRYYNSLSFFFLNLIAKIGRYFKILMIPIYSGRQ